MGSAESQLLCNNIKCGTFMGKDRPESATILCPKCHQVGYCCQKCLEYDKQRHQVSSCQNLFK